LPNFSYQGIGAGGAPISEQSPLLGPCIIVLASFVEAAQPALFLFRPELVASAPTEPGLAAGSDASATRGDPDHFGYLHAAPVLHTALERSIELALEKVRRVSRVLQT
jgi:hypothetical protein